MATARELFDRHYLAVFRFLRRMGLPQADAEDLTQDVFLRIVQGLPTYQERHSRPHLRADPDGEAALALATGWYAVIETRSQ